MTKDSKFDLEGEKAVELLTQVHETRRALHHSVTSWGQSALRGIFILNAGAVLAVLSHVQTLNTNPAAVYGFTSGAIYAVVAAGFAYLHSALKALNYIANSEVQLDSSKQLPSWLFVSTLAAFACMFVTCVFFCLSCWSFIEQVQGNAQALLCDQTVQPTQ